MAFFCSCLQVFCDFHPGCLFTDKDHVNIKDLIERGRGAFGIVYEATFHKEVKMNIYDLSI